VAMRVIEVTAISKLQWIASIYSSDNYQTVLHHYVPCQILCAARRDFTKRKYVLLQSKKSCFCM